MADNLTVLNSTGGTFTIRMTDVGAGILANNSIPTSTSGSPMSVQAGAAVVSTAQGAAVVVISSLSPTHLVTPSSAVQVTLTSATVTLSSNPTITSITSGTVAVGAGANTANVVAGSSAVTSTMSALVVALSTLGNFSVTTSSQVQITNGTNTANVMAASSTPTSTMAALLVAISPNGVNPNGQTTSSNSAPVVIASNQTAFPINLASSAGTLAYVSSTTITSSMNAIVVALSTFGATGGSTTVSISSAATPKNYLWNSGSSNNGILNNTTITLFSSEMTSLASSGTVTSAAGGASGLFTSSNTGQAIWGEIFLTGNTTATTAAGANISGWFLTTPNGGTTIETTAIAAIPRAPDFYIPLPTGTLGSSTTYKAAGLVRIPALQFKVNVQNNAGVVWGSSTSGYTTLQLVPIAEQY